MAKRNLLLVDADSRSLRVLEVSLRKAGYSVATCASADEALELAELSRPDLILSDTVLGDVDGFALVERLRGRTELAEVPLMFLSSDGSVESKVRGLELGVEDYLTKPIYIKEIITRVNLVLQRFDRQGIERRSLTKTRFSGSLSEMGLVDLLQTIDISRKSGVLHLSQEERRGAIYFEEGSLVHAELGSSERARAEGRRGEHAVYRFLIWNDGHFDLEFRPVRVAERTIRLPTQALLMEGMRRVDEWGRMLEQLPPLDRIFEVEDEQLIERLAEIPDELNELLRLFDGRRSLLQVVDDRGDDDLATLESISKLYFEGLIVDTGRDAAEEEEPVDEETLLPAPGRAKADSLAPDATVGGHVGVSDRAASMSGTSGDFAEDPEPSVGTARPANPGTDRASGVEVDARDGTSVPSRTASPPGGRDDPKGVALDAGGGEQPGSEERPEVPSAEGVARSEVAAPEREVSEVAATSPVNPSESDTTDDSADSTSDLPDQGSELPAPDDDSADDDSTEVSSAEPSTSSEASMAKKGNRRRKRTKKVVAESNVIQFPAQKVATGETLAAEPEGRDDASGQHRVENEAAAERAARAEEAAKKRADAEAKRADAEAKRSEAEAKRAEAEAKQAEAEAKQAEAEAKGFDVKRAEAEVKKAEAEAKKADAKSDADAAKAARERADVHRDEAKALAEEAVELEAEAKALEGEIGGLEAKADALQAEAKGLLSEAESLETEAASLEAAAVGVAVDADEEARASAPAPRAKASEAKAEPTKEEPKSEAKSGPAPKKEAKAEPKKAEPKKAEAKAEPKSEAKSEPTSKKKQKDKRTSSSQTIRAITTTGEHAAVAEDFFTAKAYEAEIEHETWDDLELDRLPASHDSRTWKRVTLGFAIAGVLVIGGYWMYHNVLMPAPVTLGRTSGTQLPELGAVVMDEPSLDETADEGAEVEAPVEAAAEEPVAGEETAAEEAVAEEATAEEAAAEGEEAPEEAPAEEAAPVAAAGDVGAYAALLEEANSLRGVRRIRKLQEALAVNPNGAEALEEVGWHELNRGNNRGALELAERASVLLPRSSKVWITLGAARQALGDREGANAAYRSCTEAEGQYVAECRRMAR